MFRLLLTIACVAMLGYACKQKTTVTVKEDTDTTAVNTDTVVIKVPTLTRAWETDTLLRTPESVLYDPANNILYVSNVGGVPPTKKDGDGFISQVSTDGKIINLKWATGFDAPKGMALLGNTLYVTDIDRLKAIDTKTGKTINTWKVPGAAYLNDVSVSDDSIIYFTDFEKSTIHQLRKGKLSVVKTDASLEGTNGIYVDGNTLLLAGSKSGNVYTMNISDQSVQKLAEGIPSGDGIERYNDGWIVSNWNGQIYHIDDMGKVTMLIDTQADKLNSADIEVIEERNLLLVPTFHGNKVVAYTMKVGG